jgi:NitT/TauT family transport system ATP-binding protein
MIEVRGASLAFGPRRVLSQISFDVRAGEFVCVAPSRAIVFQDYSNALSLEASGVAEPGRSRRVRALITQMKLDAAARQFPGQLSGGMQQRVEIARQGLQDEVTRLAADPGRIAERITVDIPRPRSQLETREDGRFLEYRHRLFGLLQQ